MEYGNTCEEGEAQDRGDGMTVTTKAVMQNLLTVKDFEGKALKRKTDHRGGQTLENFNRL